MVSFRTDYHCVGRREAVEGRREEFPDFPTASIRMTESWPFDRHWNPAVQKADDTLGMPKFRLGSETG